MFVCFLDGRSVELFFRIYVKTFKNLQDLNILKFIFIDVYKGLV